MKSKKKPNLFYKTLKGLFVILIAFILYFSYILFAPNISPKTNENAFLNIPDNCNYEDVLILLKESAHVTYFNSFKQASTVLQYSERIHSGRYEIKPNMNNFQLIRILRSGRQTPVKLTFNNIRTKEQLAARLGKQLMTDSASILTLLNDSAFLSEYELNPNNSITLFIPNTYEVFWDINAKELFRRMDKEYNKFWTDERKQKAAAISLKPTEVSTLASIVEEETNNKNDRPMVAGLYINRLKKNMLLQADPTVKFGLGNFGIKRILLTHLKSDSPYNTYQNKGLPPGPIRVATPEGIDAVLNYTHHNFIYMCASERLNGEHKFAATWEEHKINAQKYRQELNRIKIYK